MGNRRTRKPSPVDVYNHAGEVVASFDTVDATIAWLMAACPERYKNRGSAYSLVRQHLSGRPLRRKSRMLRPPRAPYRFAYRGVYLRPITIEDGPTAQYRSKVYEEAVAAGFVYAHTLTGKFKFKIESTDDLIRANCGGKCRVNKRDDESMLLPRCILRKERYDDRRPMARHGAKRADGYDIEVVEPLTNIVLATVHGVVAAEKILGWRRSKISECANGLKEMYKGFIIRKKESGSDECNGDKG